MRSTTTCMPTRVRDMSAIHAASLGWTITAEGHLRVSGFNDLRHPHRANHACLDLTYELEDPGSISYAWKVSGCDAQGTEIFDRYWYLKGPNGIFLSGEDFLPEADEFALHTIDGLEPGEYTLTVGVFCLGCDGEVLLNLSP